MQTNELKVMKMRTRAYLVQMTPTDTMLTNYHHSEEAARNNSFDVFIWGFIYMPDYHNYQRKL